MLSSENGFPCMFYGGPVDHLARIFPEDTECIIIELIQEEQLNKYLYRYELTRPDSVRVYQYDPE